MEQHNQRRHPPGSPSATTVTRAVWNGVVIAESAGTVNPDAAWYYPRPTFLARRIKNHVAFWNGVQIERHWRPAQCPQPRHVANRGRKRPPNATCRGSGQGGRHRCPKRRGVG
jgi:uncharacterized protein (DUF427 family)